MDTVRPPLSVHRLRPLIGTPHAPLIVDVRRSTAFASDPRLIAGATWRDPFAVDEWAKYLPRHRAVLVYCVHGFEISRNVAAALWAEGLDADFLEDGLDAWRQAGGSTLRADPAAAIPSLPNRPSVWVTRERPKIDRIACPWLIRRFIDPLAEFRYVPSQEVLTFAEREHAIAYDVPNVRFTHRGERCSFDALIEDFDLDDPTLTDLAAIVRGADTGRLDLTPQSPGLAAVSLGLSALYDNDHEMLRHGMTVYDALYVWLRAARGEVHNADLFARDTAK